MTSCRRRLLLRGAWLASSNAFTGYIATSSARTRASIDCLLVHLVNLRPSSRLLLPHISHNAAKWSVAPCAAIDRSTGFAPSYRLPQRSTHSTTGDSIWVARLEETTIGTSSRDEAHTNRHHAPAGHRCTEASGKPVRKRRAQAFAGDGICHIIHTCLLPGGW
jgi:hypothetical protein